MANPEHLRTLGQGVGTWNAWRQEHPEAHINLCGASFAQADLIGANFKNADLRGSDLSGTNLGGALLSGAFLGNANLSGANLHGAKLDGASLKWADLEGANLLSADLTHANLAFASLMRADLADAELLFANFSRTDLRSANLMVSRIDETKFVSVDLTETNGLANCRHLGPSIVDHRTLLKSNGVPDVFWRGCGLPDRLIEYLPSLVNNKNQFYSCFISYSSSDQEFADQLHADLQNAGVRCWFAPHNLRTGDRIRDTIDKQIRLHEKLLLILSDRSVSSNWVESEVEAALEKEGSIPDRKAVLFPIRIDNSIEGSDVAWSRTIKQTRHIADFSAWKSHDAYQKALMRLLRDLTLEC